MTRLALAAWLSACRLLTAAQPAEGPEAPPPPGRWVVQGASLLFYDGAGQLSGETGLGQWEESTGSRLSAREIRAGTSPNGRFAWTLERTTLWNPQRTKVLEAPRRRFSLLGPAGKELWSSSEADAPEGGEPATFSADGETLLLALRLPQVWRVQARSWVGNVLLEAGPFPRLEMISLTPHGRYATARWAVPDQSATHTFIELATKTRVDIPSRELVLGLARITDDGKVYSGKKFVYDFAAPRPPAVAPAPEAPPGETPVR